MPCKKRVGPKRQPLRLVHLNDDVIGVVFENLLDSLAPNDAVAFASTCSEFKTLAKSSLATLKQRHEIVKALFAKEYKKTQSTSVRDATSLSWLRVKLTVDDTLTLGDIIKSGLPRLYRLEMNLLHLGPAGVQTLAKGLVTSALPSLCQLGLMYTRMGDAGISALAQAFDRGAAPSLQHLGIGMNDITDVGVVSLAGPLRKRLRLQGLYMNANEISDGGIASLLAPATADLPPLHLRLLHLTHNKIGDDGCSSIINAIHHDVLPNLRELTVNRNPIGMAGKEAMRMALIGRGIRKRDARRAVFGS